MVTIVVVKEKDYNGEGPYYIYKFLITTGTKPLTTKLTLGLSEQEFRDLRKLLSRDKDGKVELYDLGPSDDINSYIQRKGHLIRIFIDALSSVNVVTLTVDMLADAIEQWVSK